MIPPHLDFRPAIANLASRMKSDDPKVALPACIAILEMARLEYLAPDEKRTLRDMLQKLDCGFET